MNGEQKNALEKSFFTNITFIFDLLSENRIILVRMILFVKTKKMLVLQKHGFLKRGWMRIHKYAFNILRYKCLLCDTSQIYVYIAMQNLLLFKSKQSQEIKRPWKLNWPLEDCNFRAFQNKLMKFAAFAVWKILYGLFSM